MADRLTSQAWLADASFPPCDGLAQAALTARVQKSLDGAALREFWKYTPVADFADDFRQPSVQRPRLRGLDQPGVELLSLADDGLQGAFSPLGPADEASSVRFPFADLALLISGDLLSVRIDATLTRPLRVEFEEGLSIPLLLVLGPGVEARLVEQNTARASTNHSLYVHLSEGSTLHHASAALNESASHWSLTQVVQETNSRYRRQQYQRGGRKRRTETQVLLNGRGAETLISGAYVVGEGTHLDQQLVVEHRAPATLSRQKFHGIGVGKGTAVFGGRIHIHPGAAGSDAELSNRNLALHPEAVINTKPELEIYTDDVKCAHGATVGQISEESLFYLQSRGLSLQQSKLMLCRAFINECIEGDLEDAAIDGLLEFFAET